MDALVHLGLLNAALATVLALLAAAARCVCRRPAVMHALWLLVLLKLLTPPFVPIPIASWPVAERTFEPPSSKKMQVSARFADAEMSSSLPASPRVTDRQEQSRDGAIP